MSSASSSVQQQFFRSLNRVVEPLVRSGFAAPLPCGGLGLALVESTGRVTGVTRTVPVVAVRLGDRVLTSTVRSDSQWMRNLEADADAGVWLNGRRRAARATVRRGPLTVAELALT